MNKEEIKKEIGGNIRKARELAGVSQIELAKGIGHQSAAYISFAEKGERNITATDLTLVAKFLRIPSYYLLPHKSTNT